MEVYKLRFHALRQGSRYQVFASHAAPMAWHVLNDQFLGKGTSPTLVLYLILTALSQCQWMSSETPDIILNPPDFAISVRPIIIQQNAIGWRHLFNGRFGKEWNVHQDQYYKSRPASQGLKHTTTGESGRWALSFTSGIRDLLYGNIEIKKSMTGHAAHTKAVAL